MFGLIRFVIGLLIFGILVIVIKKNNKTVKRALYVGLSCVSILIVILLSFVPFENLFISFKTPKAAYDYYTFGNADIELLLEGKNCDFIIVRKRETDVYSMIPKTENGWKIGIGSNLKRVLNYTDNEIDISVFRYKKTSDYFITVLDLNGGEASVSDAYGNVFYSLKTENRYLDKPLFTYFAYVPEFSSDYSLKVDGKTVKTGDGSNVIKLVPVS